MILDIIFFIACVKLLDYTGRPFFCAGIYTGLTIISALLFGSGFPELAVGAVIAMSCFSLFFWLLDRYEDSFGVYCLVLVAGSLSIFLRTTFVEAIMAAAG